MRRASPVIDAYGGRSLHEQSPNAKILLLDQGGYRQVRYEDTEHYQLMRRFLIETEDVLKAVFAENGEMFPDS